ncbi:MAG: AAA family ATPase [bacterium]|nr:AAA family ATPase [bacterium]
MDLFKIVLTGGPCSGKTKVLEALKEYYLSQKGIYLRTVGETATELIDAGIKPQLSVDSFSFQKIVFSRQLNKEITTLDYKYKDSDNSKNIIIYDRGLNDNKAYIDQKQYDLILNIFNKSEIEILNDYDLIIDLVSTAGSSIAQYETESNLARYETESEAISLDKRTTCAWIGHRNLRIIMPTENIEEKIRIVKKEINNLIEGKSYKIIRRYILDIDNDCSLYNDDNSKTFDIEKIYLNYNVNDIYQYIITKRTYKDNSSYSVSLERNIGNVNTKKFEISINEEKVIELIKEFGIIKTINKKITYFEYDHKRYCINQYEDTNILEVELENSFDSIVIPNNLNIISTINEDYDSIIESPKIKNKKLIDIVRR